MQNTTTSYMLRKEPKPIKAESFPVAFVMFEIHCNSSFQDLNEECGSIKRTTNSSFSVAARFYSQWGHTVVLNFSLE